MGTEATGNILLHGVSTAMPIAVLNWRIEQREAHYEKTETRSYLNPVQPWIPGWSLWKVSEWLPCTDGGAEKPLDERLARRTWSSLERHVRRFCNSVKPCISL